MTGVVERSILTLQRISVWKFQQPAHKQGEDTSHAALTRFSEPFPSSGAVSKVFWRMINPKPPNFYCCSTRVLGMMLN